MSDVMMKILMIVVICMFSSSLTAQQLPFEYDCTADSDALEGELCQALYDSVQMTGLVTLRRNASIRYYKIVVVPIQHQDGAGVSASITVNYVDSRCNPFFLSTYNSVISVPASELVGGVMDQVAHDVINSVMFWDKSMKPRVGEVCAPARFLDAMHRSTGAARGISERGARR
jgi:hypothetical protein